MDTLASLFNLSGQVVVVTDGSRGLGLQVVSALGDYGASVARVARQRSELNEAPASLSAQGVGASPFAIDLNAANAAAELTDGVIKRFARIDVLVDNAGTTWGATTETYPLSGWNKLIDLRLTSISC